MITDLRVDDILPEMRAEVEQHETHTSQHREAVQRFVPRSGKYATRQRGTGWLRQIQKQQSTP